MKTNSTARHSDVALIGTGIMSATLGTLLRQLEPPWTIRIFERMDAVAIESPEARNNAGTGHSAFCELNYTPEKPDGSIEIGKAVQIASAFEVSKEFWATLVRKGIIADPTTVIRRTPHMTFRPLCRLFHQISQTRVVPGSAAFREMGQYLAPDLGGCP